MWKQVCECDAQKLESIDSNISNRLTILFDFISNHFLISSFLYFSWLDFSSFFSYIHLDLGWGIYEEWNYFSHKTILEQDIFTLKKKIVARPSRESWTPCSASKELHHYWKQVLLSKDAMSLVPKSMNKKQYLWCSWSYTIKGLSSPTSCLLLHCWKRIHPIPHQLTFVFIRSFTTQKIIHKCSIIVNKYDIEQR